METRTNEIRTGAIVQVHYTVKLADGTVFDSTREREPFVFTIGAGEVLPAFESAVSRMNPGDMAEVELSAEEAYGPYREDLVLRVDRDRISAAEDLVVGMKVWVKRADGEPMAVIINNITDSIVKLDTNHPLAGHDLVFEILFLRVV